MDFLWRLTSCIGLYSSVSYCAEVSAGSPCEDVKVLPLDPCHVSGNAQLSRLRSIAVVLDLKFVFGALHWLEDPSDLWLEPPPDEINHHRPSHSKYIAHLEEMASCGITKKLQGPQGLRWISGYFAVPKNDSVSRAVFNGKQLSRLFVCPPPVNIPSVSDIFDLLSRLIPSGGKWFAFTADIRHWFHQIPIGRALASWMGLHSGSGDYFQYRVLPMGWSFSPRICQCLAWCLIIAPPGPYKDGKVPRTHSNEDGLAIGRKYLRQQEHPPKFVLLHDNGVVVGFITLTYDNIGMWCSNEGIFDCLVRKIDQLSKWCNITMKTQDPVNYCDLLLATGLRNSAPFAMTEAKGTSHLGIQYALRVDNGQHRAAWRLDPERINRYSPVLDLLEDEHVLTRREVGRIVGIIIWHLAVIQRPLCYAVTLMTILRSLTVDKPTLTKQEWDLPTSFSDSHRKYLGTMLGEVLRNDWHDAPAPRSNSAAVYTIFTDSSKNCMGSVIVSPDGSSTPESMLFHPKIQNVHIYLKELTAQVWFCVKCIKMMGFKRCHIQLVTDNSAVYFGILHMYSSNAFASRWIKYLHQCLVEAECTWSVFLVISEDNPADGPSRFQIGVCEKRLAAGLKAVEASINGCLRSSMPGAAFQYRDKDQLNSLRHTDCPGTTSSDDLDDIALSFADFAPPIDFEAPSDSDMAHWFGFRKRQRSA